MGAVGLGSVTDFCMQNLRCAVIVVRELPKTEEEEARLLAAEGDACTS